MLVIGAQPREVSETQAVGITSLVTSKPFVGKLAFLQKKRGKIIRASIAVDLGKLLRAADLCRRCKMKLGEHAETATIDAALQSKGPAIKRFVILP